MRHALFLPPFGELSDARALARIAATAEASGFDGVFLWDHVLRPPADPQQIADPWICLTAIALATSRIRIGTMVTPLTRRRPIVVARQAATLDQLSGGRVVLGLGLGVDSGGELSKFGEVVDPVVRGQRLDEAAAVLSGLFSGSAFSFAGAHFSVDDVTFEPTPVQRPSIPMWFAARGAARKPVRRAAAYDGLFPIEVDLESLGQMLNVARDERGGSLDGFDVAVIAGAERGPSDDVPLLASMGVTWLLHDTRPGATVAQAMAVAEAGPVS